MAQSFVGGELEKKKSCGCKKCSCGDKAPVKFDSFAEFVQNEMAGTGAIYDGTKSPDFQWQGDPKSMIRPKKKKK